MQSCAFFWGKINMIRAYTGGSDLAIVLGGRWLVVARRKKARIASGLREVAAGLPHSKRSCARLV